MSSASVRDVEHGSSDDEDHDARVSAYDLLALVEALHGVEQILVCPRPTCSATAREELWAASEIVGWVLELLPEASAGSDGPIELRELQVALLRGQAQLTSAAQHFGEATRWDDMSRWLTRTRRLLTVAAASLMP
jgi:hypothetical protein